MAPQIIDVQERILDFSPAGARIKVRQFTPRTNNDFVATDYANTRTVGGFFSGSASLGAQEGFYIHALTGPVNLAPSANLITLNSAFLPVVTVNLE